LESSEKVFLEMLFCRFNALGIRYAVMRNYRSLPYSVGGSDLDIMVHLDDENLARVAIIESITAAGGVTIGYSNTIGFFKAYSFGFVKGPASGWWGVRLDVSVGMRYGGVADIFDIERLEKRYCVHNEIKVLPNDLAAILGVIKELLHNNKLPPRYLSGAKEAVERNWTELRHDLAPMGETAIALLGELCLTSAEASAISAKSMAFRRALLRTALLRSPLSYLRFGFLYQWSKICRLIKPPGMIVAVLGTDGAGKSTIISAIEPVLSAATHGAFIVKHLRPGLLPPLARLKGKLADQAGPVTHPHGSKASGGIGSLLRVVYLMADYVLGYWLVIRPKIAKEPTIVLFDRYAYDIALDPRRFRIGLSGGLVRLFTRFAPKPDLIICLHGDPSMIAARKQELPLNEVRRQTEALKEFCKKEARAVLISTDGTVEQARDDVLNALKFVIARVRGQ